MSAQGEIDRFAQDVANNDGLRNELKAFGSDQEAVINYANSRGYNFAMADIESRGQDGEISDDQLENVAGGIFMAIGDGVAYTGSTKSGICVRSGGKGHSAAVVWW